MNDNSIQGKTVVYRIHVLTLPQLKAAAKILRQFTFVKVDRIYLDGDMLLSNLDEAQELCRGIREQRENMSFCISLPAILRADDGGYLEKIRNLLSGEGLFTGVLTGSLEGMGYFQNAEKSYSVFADHSFYLWNTGAVKAWCGMLAGACLPLELGSGEQKQLLWDSADLIKKDDPPFWDKMIYGRIPLMQTANCIAKTKGLCFHGKEEMHREMFYLRDRKSMEFPVAINCAHCMNTIYNSLPLTLPNLDREFFSKRVAFRLSFVSETEGESERILQWYFCEGDGGRTIPFWKYTTGHEKRTVL